MLDVLNGVHSSSSTATYTLDQLTEKVADTYSTMESHDNSALIRN